MMKKLIKIFTMLFIIFGLSSCVNSNSKEYFDIQYSNEEINKESFDNYFKSNKDLYPSYETLKENNRIFLIISSKLAYLILNLKCLDFLMIV